LTAARRLETVSGAVDRFGPHGDERLEMRADGAPGREVAAGRRDVGAARAREQRPEQQHRTTQASDERAVGLVRADRLTADGERRTTDPFHLGAEVEQQTRHHVHVGDARHVREHAGVFGEQRRRHERQRGVLVALDVDDAREPVPTFDDQCRHACKPTLSPANRPAGRSRL
jgi:hypothetical protein